MRTAQENDNYNRDQRSAEARDMGTRHELINHGLVSPRLVTTPLRHVNPALLGTPEQREAFLDAQAVRPPTPEDKQEAEEHCAWWDAQRLTPDDINAIAHSHE